MKLGFTPAFSPVVIPTTSCVAKVVAQNRGRNGKLKDACGSQAKITINGKPYCLRHAQQLALNILIKEKIAEMKL